MLRSVLGLSWPFIAWFASRWAAEAIFDDAWQYRAMASTAAPLIVALIAIVAAMAGAVPLWAGLICLAGSAISGVIGFLWEANRWSPFLGEPHVTLWYMLRHLDYGLVATSVAALLLPVAPLLRGVAGLEALFGLDRSKSAFGTAAFLSVREAAARLSKGDLVIGEAYDPARMLPKPGTAPLLRFEGNEHLLTVGGAGTGKTTAIAIPNCLSWTGSLVVLDPKGELAAQCRQAREAMGHDVVTLDPSSVDSDAINVLDWLDASRSEVIEHVSSVVTWLTGGKEPDGSNAVFEKDARDLLEAIILDVVCDLSIPHDRRTLAEVQRRCSCADWVIFLQDLEAKGAGYGHGIVAPTAGRFATMAVAAPAQWQGVQAHLLGMISWLKRPNLANLVSGVGRKSIPVASLLSGRTDVFVAVPLRTLDSDPAVARVILGALLNTVYESFERTKKVQSRVLFLLDEMPRLKRMEILQTARDAGRGLGVTLWAIVQDLGQLDQCYGRDGARGWIESTRVMNFLAVRHPETAEFVSSALGDATIKVTSSSSNTGTSGGYGALWGQQSSGKSTSQNYMGRRLMTPGEVMQMRVDENGTADEQILFIRGMKPIRAGVAKFWRRPDMKNAVS